KAASAGTRRMGLGYADTIIVARSARPTRRLVDREGVRQLTGYELFALGSWLHVMPVDGLDDEAADFALGVARRGADVRGEDDVGPAGERAAELLPFLFVHVEGGAGQLAAVQSAGYRFLVYDAAPAEVDEEGAALHLRQRCVANQVVRVFAQRRMNGQEVGAGEHPVEAGQADAALGELLGLDRRGVVYGADDLHAPGGAHLAHAGADDAGADDAQHFAVEVQA